ncbi:MAG: hypothetical protein QNJ81_02105 [Acidimicrobiia bacterium]|nr:hypothetical protein [Acidimicrobiia bacterium]
MEHKDIIEVLWAIWFGVLMLYPLFRIKPEARFYGEKVEDDEEL